MKQNVVINRLLVVAFALVALYGNVFALDHKGIVSFEASSEHFSLVENGVLIPILLDAHGDGGVERAVNNLVEDFFRVTGSRPMLHLDVVTEPRAIIVATWQSDLVRQLVLRGKLTAGELEGKNEKYLMKTVPQPLDGIDEALLIIGSDKRGAIYGVYELSEQIGVSPWYYWADVPCAQHSHIAIARGSYTAGEPAVKYRGVFLNDEWPSLGTWAAATFGGFNSQFYERVFELILRLRGNFLWPAMWSGAFYDDDPRNSPLAHEMGIVISTSHHEPMARAHKEWGRYGKGTWNYATNRKVLDEFWRFGIERMKHTEDIVTLAMRGDGDEPMSEENNIALLERIVKNQRRIIADVTQQGADALPQVWALYKEVQEYYDRGMRVPDDVILLFCDDNWGNVRKLPEPEAKRHPGGYGMYYHFDYVGGPRNYKWLNVTQVQRVWEQMNLTYEHGVDKIWVVNVGDLKPMEYPITFFLDMAWNPKQFRPDNLHAHTVAFCQQQFGEPYAEQAARLINLYTKYNHRVTPEVLDANTYSLENYNEWQRVADDYRQLRLEALQLFHSLPHSLRDAFDQLVLFPIQASSNLYDLYYSVAMNRHLAEANDPACNAWARRAKKHFEADSLLCQHYNNSMSGGKWKGMMNQTHIGYTSWQEPTVNRMPQVTLLPEQALVSPIVHTEREGVVSFEAEHFSRANDAQGAQWTVIPDLGKTLSGLTTLPSSVVLKEVQGEGLFVEYDFITTSKGTANVIVLLSTTLNFNANRGLRFALSLDGGDEQIVNYNHDHSGGQWDHWMRERIIRTSTPFTLPSPGRHTLRLRLLDSGTTIQKLMIDLGGLRPSFLGAPAVEP